MLCLGFVSICNAISFGNIKVYSYLDEPLVAELELTDLNGVDPSRLLVSLADSKEFVRAGMERPYFLTNLLFDIIATKNSVLIYIRSIKPVKTPYLEFLLNLSWPDGSLIKEYTILIDPAPFDLSSETRPKALAQLALEESEAANFGDENIKQQLEAQDLASRSNVVVQRPRDIRDQLLSDETFNAEDPSTAVKTELIPEVVPDVTDQAAQKPTASSEPENTIEYQKQVEEFKQRQQEAVNKQNDSGNKDLLDRVIERLKASSMLKSPKVDIDQLAADRKKHLDANANSKEVSKELPKVGATTKVPASPVVPPSSATAAPAAPANPITPPPISAPPPAAALPTNLPSQSTLPAPATPGVTDPSLTAPVPLKSEGIKSSFLILIGVFILVLAAAIGFIIKRRLRAKPAEYNKQANEIAAESNMPITPQKPDKHNQKKYEIDEDDLDFDLDLSDEPDADVLGEEIKLGDSSDAELAKFEQDLTSIDLDELLQPEKAAAAEPATIVMPAAATTTASVAVDDLNATENIDIVAVPIADDASDLDRNLASEEGNVASLNLKIELAKRYLEAGDKDSARDILGDVIAEAKNEQKLAAEILLSGIV